MALQSFIIDPPTRSTIFLNDITVVDHAYIDSSGRVVGGSFNPCFEVSGTPDPTEKVVVDFSSIKKDIKELIDRHNDNMFTNGFDHKVWVIDGFSNIVTLDSHPADLKSISYTMIKTPSLELTLPSDAVKWIPRSDQMVANYDDHYIGAAFAEYLQPLLQEKYPLINIEVKCYNTTNIHVPTESMRTRAKMFRYVHGLKDSTSYGCKNIAHGHGSFITSDTNPDNILEEVANELDDTLFVRGDNVVLCRTIDNTVEELTIQYSTPRGDFSMTVSPSTHKLVILNTETTVEYLAQYVKTKYGKRMKDLGMTFFYISEGLSKGAVETL